MAENHGRVLTSYGLDQKWAELNVAHQLQRTMAGQFRGWMPDGFLTSGTPRILYVGKATSGSFGESQPEREWFNGSGAFWSFARQIARTVGCRDDSIPCIAWTNISKISLPQIAADSTLIAGFEKIAIATLEAEIATARPQVIVFVTGHFNDAVVREIAEGQEDNQWNKSENESISAAEDDVWWRRRHDGAAVLWMRHPQGAQSEKLSFAAEKIRVLLQD